jgi:hypothetical protein
VRRYSTPASPSVEDIEKRLLEIGPAMEKYTKVESGINERTSKFERVSQDSQNLTKELEKNLLEIERLQRRNEQIVSEKNAMLTELESLNEQITKGREWIKNTVKPDNTAITKELSDAKIHNEHHRKINEYVQKQKDMIASKNKYQSLQNEVEALLKKRADIIASSNLPIAGLSFSDNQVYYNGLPFERGQINTQTLLEVGEEICMSMHPNLKVIFVEDGSLYDKKSLKRLVEKAHNRGYQVIAEIVDPAGGELEIKFIEEYLNA